MGTFDKFMNDLIFGNKCPMCKGKGEYEGGSGDSYDMVTCERCGGTGHTDDENDDEDDVDE